MKLEDYLPEVETSVIGLAKLFKVHESNIRNLIKHDLIKSDLINNRRVIKREYVREFLLKNELPQKWFNTSPRLNKCKYG